MVENPFSSVGQSDQVLLRRLSVFVGGFTPEAAAEVCSGDGLRPDQVGPCLKRFLGASLVEQMDGTSTRYRLLEPVREAASLQLANDGEAEEASWRHAHWASTLAQPEPSAGSGMSLVGLNAEADNLRAALAWSLENDAPMAVELVSSLTFWWRMRGAFREGWSYFEQVLPHAESLPPGLQAKTFWGAGFMAARSARPDEARKLLERSIELARAESDAQTLGRAFLVLGSCQSEVAEAVVLYDQSITSARAAGDLWALANSLTLRGLVRMPDEADEKQNPMLAEAVAVARDTGDVQTLCFALMASASWEQAHGSLEQARLLFEEGRDVAISGGYDYEAEAARRGLAQVALAEQADPGWDKLTKGEWDVVGGVVRGLSNPEIAEELFVARATVRNRLTRVFTKTGLDSRLELARKAAHHLPEL